MRKLTEGRKMFLSIMAVFASYAIIFILFEDYDRKMMEPFNEASDWHLLLFSLVVMGGLGILLWRYARRMDERISREQAAKENQMRRELTQNIAHELKTPVASILGYAETILHTPSISDSQKQMFTERTLTQAQRLATLLQDISILNRMDFAQDVIQMGRVDVSLIMNDIVEETALAFRQKEMSLHNCLPQGIIIHGNEQLIYSIFRNLTDNALNYAGYGTTVEVSATKDREQWHITFKDNGAGIPQQHLPRIFERFYRIDKSRSRTLGGTGLGLSIVKNAVRLHGGDIKIRSNQGEGTTFVITLKQI